MTTPDRQPVALWLLACAALVFAMVVVGGVTRLTRSGLSIVEWEPIVGAIPPLTQEQWDGAFERYKQTPEYQKVNAGMDLDGFKTIFYVEWFHRLLGRLIGFVFLLPFLYFLIRKRIERRLAPRLAAIFVLGGLQGALGWYMVRSGLVDVPRVSPYRLTAHLGLAVAIYALILWTALSLLAPRPAAASALRPLRRAAVGLAALIYVMLLSGGFVAGTRAGFAFNTFPLMNGRFLPEGMYALTPWWTNLFENIATVQFNHRLIAYLLAAAIPSFWFVARHFNLPARARLAAHLLLAALAAQISLGIATLINVVPVPLAAAHQAGALLLFTIALYLVHELRPAR